MALAKTVDLDKRVLAALKDRGRTNARRLAGAMRIANGTVDKSLKRLVSDGKATVRNVRIKGQWQKIYEAT